MITSMSKTDTDTRAKAQEAMKGPLVGHLVAPLLTPTQVEEVISDAMARLKASFDKEGNLHPFKVMDANKADIALVAQAKGFFYLEDRFGMTRGCISAWNKSRKLGIKTPSRSSFKSEPPPPPPRSVSLQNEAEEPDKYLSSLSVAEQVVYWRARAEAMILVLRIIS